jgi:photosystem II stability/assembly factor-like uncharacterized protein
VTLDPTNQDVVYGIAQDHFRAMKFTGTLAWAYMGGGGETGKVLVDPSNPNRLYDYDPLSTTSFIHRSDDGGASWTDTGTGIDTSQNGSGLAYTAQKAFVMDPSNSARLLVATDKVYETTNSAGSWTAISPVLSSGQFITFLAVAPSRGPTVYASTNDGRFFVTTNDGTWTEADVGLPRNAASAIEVDPANPQHVFVSLFNSGVWVTSDGGTSWTSVTGNLPPTFAVNTMAIDWRGRTPVLYVGTSRGVYRSLDQGATWAAFGQGLPNTSVTDLEFAPQLDLLAAGTYGRGVFEITLPGPASHFRITAPPGATAGSPFTITVTAVDAAGNTAAAYTGTVHFGKSDAGSGSALPADYTFVPGDNGTHTFSNGVVLVTAGSQSVTATDTTSSITGSATVNIGAAAATHLESVP